MKIFHKTESAVFSFDDVRIDAANFKLEKNGEQQKITPRAFEVLVYLVENAGRVVEKQELFEEIWQESFVSDNALTRIVKEIRHTIGDDAAAPRYIETVPKRGYRFISTVETIEDKKSEEIVFETLKPKTNGAVPQTFVEESQISQNGNLANVNKPRRTWLPVFTVLLLIILPLTVWLFYRNSSQTQDAPVIARNVQVTNWAGLDNYPAISPDGNTIAYSSEHNGDFEIYVKPLAAGAKEIQITSDGQFNLQPAWSPDGQRIAFYSKRRGGIWVVPATGGVAKQLTSFGASPAWSPDGQTIAFQSGAVTDIGPFSRVLPPSVLWLVASDGGEPRQLTQLGNPAGGHNSPAWSPDGKHIAFNVEDVTTNSIYSVGVNGENIKQINPFGFDPVYTPDGKSVYFVSERGLSRIGVQSGADKPVTVISPALAMTRHLSISADGKRIAYSLIKSASNIWSVSLDAKTSEAVKEPFPLTENTAFRNSNPSISPDGRRIVYVSWKSGSRGELWLMDADGKNQTQISDRAGFPSWLSNSEQIFFTSRRETGGSVKLFSINLTTGKEAELTELGKEVEMARVSPDGKEIAFNSRKDGAINVWIANVETGKQEQFTFDNDLMGFPAWSPSGKVIGLQMKRGDDTHVAVKPREGGDIVQLTSEPGQSWIYSFAPDNDKIVFSGQRDGIWNLYWVSRSTGEQKKLTNNNKLTIYLRYPAWSPSGSQIIYEQAETTGNVWMLQLQ